MIESRHSAVRPLAVVALATLTFATALAVPATAQGPAWTSFKVKGEFARKAFKACGKSKNFRLFHAGSMIEARGFVTPPPAKHFPAEIKIKRCSKGRFVHFEHIAVVGKKLIGKVKGFFQAPPLPRRRRHHRRVRIVFYRASGIYNGVESEMSYFAVVR